MTSPLVTRTTANFTSWYCQCHPFFKRGLPTIVHFKAQILSMTSLLVTRTTANFTSWCCCLFISPPSHFKAQILSDKNGMDHGNGHRGDQKSLWTKCSRGKKSKSNVHDVFSWSNYVQWVKELIWNPWCPRAGEKMMWSLITSGCRDMGTCHTVTCRQHRGVPWFLHLEVCSCFSTC